MSQINIEDLQFNEIGQWPKGMKAVVLVIVLLLSFGVGYFITLKEPITQVTKSIKLEKKKRKQFKSSYDQAINLDAYKKQMVEMQSLFKNLLEQLPSDVQIPSLVDEISQKAAANGVRFRLLEPGKKISKGFYAELPIHLELLGDYHSLGGFVDDISKLSRIVTLHNFEISYPKSLKSRLDDSGNEILVMKVEAKTYWSISSDKGGKK